MEKDIFASQSDGVEENSWAHVVSLDSQQLLSILVEIWIIPKLVRNPIIPLLFQFLVIQSHLCLDVVTVDRIFKENFSEVVGVRVVKICTYKDGLVTGLTRFLQEKLDLTDDNLVV